MKVLLAVMATLSMVDLGTPCCFPCCFPNQLSFTFSAAINISRYVNGKHSSESSTDRTFLSGKFAVDFKAQKIALQIDTLNQHILVDLNKQPGSIEMAMQVPTAGTNETVARCQEVEISGTVGQEWQCLFDNTKYFTEQSGGESYRLTIPKIIDGPIYVNDETCLPSSVDMKVELPPQSQPAPTTVTTTYVTVEITNAVAQIPDIKLLEPPCPKGVKSENQYQITPVRVLTPEQLVGLIQSAYALGPNTSEQESASESSDEDVTTTEPESASESSDEDESESENKEEST